MIHLSKRIVFRYVLLEIPCFRKNCILARGYSDGARYQKILSLEETIELITSLTKKEKRPMVNIAENSPRIQQLGEVIKLPLWELYRKLANRSFEGSLKTLSGLLTKKLDLLYEGFIVKLYDALLSYLADPERVRSVDDIGIADFINPRMSSICQIIYLLHHGNFPANLWKKDGAQNKNGILSEIFARLLHKHYVECTLLEVPPQGTIIDLSNPAEWFPEARTMKRKFIMHVGPTNSGKTYNSLKKLSRAKSGYYAGPLRLLAREIYEKFNDEGIKCNLITGEEVIPSIDRYGRVSEISSGTIEMIPLHKMMDICIIDEIQMIADPRRGEAWTNAVLGVQAKEVHMCGEESAVPLIKRLARITGDEVIINRYERLGKLSVLEKEVGSLKNLTKGDCVIAFSKRKILELKCEIERKTSLKVGVIYGALPPEIRSKEANGFNSGAYDVLVASDAVGMGLNLKIKRIVFYATKKYNGTETIPLTVSETKQIAGRAGRYSRDHGELEGLVTAIKRKDLQFVKQTLDMPIEDLKKACIWPTNKVWTFYISKFPKHTSFFRILKEFDKDTCTLEMDNFFISTLDTRYEILKLFLRNELYKKTTIENQLRLSLAPINVNVVSPNVVGTTFKYFETISKCETKTIFDFKFLRSSILKSKPNKFATADETVLILQSLEEDHKLVLIFLWLSQRWPSFFVDKEGATDIKTLIEKRISEELLNLRKITKTRGQKS